MAAMTDRRVPSGFVFQRRSEAVDWRSLATLDLPAVVRNVDVAALQHQLSNITFCDINTEKLQGVDKNFVKLFELAQLSLEYVLYVQEHLSQAKDSSDAEVSRLSESLHELKTNYEAARKESKRRKHMLAAYQKLVDSKNVGPHKCPYCPKSFISTSYLLAHCERRHQEQSPFQFPTFQKNEETVTNTNIFKEVQQLKRDLNQFNSQSAASAEEAALETRRLRNEISQLQRELELRQRLDEESQASFNKMIKQHEQNYDNMERKYKLELQDVRDRASSEHGLLKNQLDRAIRDLRDRDDEIDTLKKQLRVTTIQLRAANGQSFPFQLTGDEEEASAQLIAQQNIIEKLQAELTSRSEVSSAQPQILSKKEKSSKSKKFKIPKSEAASTSNTVASMTAKSVRQEDSHWKRLLQIERKSAERELKNVLEELGLEDVDSLATHDFETQLDVIKNRRESMKKENSHYAAALADAEKEMWRTVKDRELGEPATTPPKPEPIAIPQKPPVTMDPADKSDDERKQTHDHEPQVPTRSSIEPQASTPQAHANTQDTFATNIQPQDQLKPSRKRVVIKPSPAEVLADPSPHPRDRSLVLGHTIAHDPQASSTPTATPIIRVVDNSPENDAGSSDSSSLTASSDLDDLVEAEPLPPPRDDPIPYPRDDVNSSDSGSLSQVSEVTEDGF